MIIDDLNELHEYLIRNPKYGYIDEDSSIHIYGMAARILRWLRLKCVFIVSALKISNEEFRREFIYDIGFGTFLIISENAPPQNHLTDAIMILNVEIEIISESQFNLPDSERQWADF